MKYWFNACLTGARGAVVQRDDDTLTIEEFKVHAQEVVAASMLSELKTWARLKCFSPRSRAMAKNILDCRWVIKWKHEVAAVSVADASKQSGASAVSKRVIRCRLPVRGLRTAMLKILTATLELVNATPSD